MKRLIPLFPFLVLAACASTGTLCLETGDVIIHKEMEQVYTREGTTPGAPGTRSMRQVYHVTVRKADGHEKVCKVTLGEYNRVQEGQPYRCPGNEALRGPRSGGSREKSHQVSR